MLLDATVADLDKAWSKDNLYIGPKDAGIAGRRDGVKRAFESGKPIDAPFVGVNEHGVLSVTDGRHRIATAREMGMPTMKVTVPADQVEQFRKFIPDPNVPARQPAAAPPAGDYASQLKQRILDAQKANPDAVAAFMGDPRANERGSWLGSYAAYKAADKFGAKSVDMAGKASSAAYGLGSAMEQSGKDAIRKSALRAAADPKRISLLANEPGVVGDAARRALQSANDPAAFAARSYMLTLMPEFRQLIAGQDADGQGGR